MVALQPLVRWMVLPTVQILQIQAFMHLTMIPKLPFLTPIVRMVTPPTPPHLPIRPLALVGWVADPLLLVVSITLIILTPIINPYSQIPALPLLSTLRHPLAIVLLGSPSRITIKVFFHLDHQHPLRYVSCLFQTYSRLTLSTDHTKQAISNMSPGPNGGYICNLCSLIFTRAHDARRHYTSKHSDVKSQCMCGKKFSRRDALLRHQRPDTVSGYGGCEEARVATPADP